MLQAYVFEYAEKNNIPHPFNKTKKCAGRVWLKNFLRDHPEISKRKAQNMNPARAQKLNRFIVNDHFSKLEKILGVNNLRASPEKIYNIDEKGVRLTLHHQLTVLARKGCKRVKLIANEHAENLFIVACGNASCNFIPPIILLKGKHYNPSFKHNLSHGSKVEMTEKGSMTQDCFIRWVEKFSKHKVEGKVILIFDGAKCRLSPTICDTAEKHNIILYHSSP